MSGSCNAVSGVRAATDGHDGGGCCPIVMAGAVPAIRSSTGVRSLRVQSVVEILPGWILGLDQVQFPHPRPMLDVLFALYRGEDVFVPLGVHEHRQTVSLGKSTTNAMAVFPNPAGDVVRDANIQRTERSVCDDVNPSATHQVMLGALGLSAYERGYGAATDGRDRPGHDDGTVPPPFTIMAGPVPAIARGTLPLLMAGTRPTMTVRQVFI